MLYCASRILLNAAGPDYQLRVLLQRFEAFAGWGPSAKGIGAVKHENWILHDNNWHSVTRLTSLALFARFHYLLQDETATQSPLWKSRVNRRRDSTRLQKTASRLDP